MLFTLQTEYNIGGNNLYAVYTGDKRCYFRRRAAHSPSVTWAAERGVGVATVTSQGAEGILVEGRHPLLVVFRGLEKSLKLSFVAGVSICEAFNNGDAPRWHCWSR